MKNQIFSVIVLGSLLNISSALADNQQPGEMDFEGTTAASIGYVGTDGGAVLSCAATFWFFGGTCDMHIGDSNFSEGKSSGDNVDSRVVVKTWGEGKVMVIYSLGSAEGCAGIQKTYVGYETAYETYNLYELSGNETDVNPTTSHPSATLSIENASADLKLFQDITANTRDGSGEYCSWNIKSDTALSFGKMEQRQ